MIVSERLTPVRSAVLAGELVHVFFESGKTAEFHPLALRDGCLCPRCRHPLSGQRRFESRDVVPHARISDVALEAGALTVDWSDGHRSNFSADWLANEADALQRGARPARPITLWGAELGTRFLRQSYSEVTSDRSAFRRWLAAIAEYGFAVLTGAPAVDGSVAFVAELFGHVRTTNYGRFFDVTVRVEATNLADTALPLSLHTDNPYRDPPPTLQLLQCLTTTVSGGKTVLADGFRAVELLSAQSPEKLALLAEWPIRFSYRDATAEFSADVPVVALDAGGLPTALHLNNRSMGIPSGPTAAVGEWYQAYFELVSLLERPDARVAFRLDPGDVVVFDNLRVLHGRTGFSGEGARRLQGCYADRDGLLSTLAALDRELPR